jgi:hypothetical protein
MKTGHLMSKDGDYGPDIEEGLYAFYALSTASMLLDQIILGKINPATVRELAHDLVLLESRMIPTNSDLPLHEHFSLRAQEIETGFVLLKNSPDKVVAHPERKLFYVLEDSEEEQ